MTVRLAPPSDLAPNDLAPTARKGCVPRPPGSLTDREMDDLCVRCGDCMEICPEAVIVCGVGGLPQLDLGRGSCNRCGLCADVCMRGAIDPLGAILLKSA